MRAHTITTKARVEARARTPRTIVALSLAVVLVATTASTASTTPSPPLTLRVDPTLAGMDCKTHVQSCTGRWLSGMVTTSNNSRVVLRGDVKRTKVRLWNDDPTSSPSHPFRAKLKHPERLRGRTVKVKVKASATDVFGQTTGEKSKYVLRRCPQSAEHAGAYATGDLCDERF